MRRGYANRKEWEKSMLYPKRLHSVFLALATLTFLSAGCAQKAKTIQAGAAQFEVESIAAIERIDELRLKELQVPPRTADDVSKKVVDLILDPQNADKSIDRKMLKLLADPFLTKSLEGEEEWQSFLHELRLQYTTFATTFAVLDRGSFFAAPAVKKTVPILDKLVAQMAAFGQSIMEHPAEFVRERAIIAAEWEVTRDDADLSDALKRERILGIQRRFQGVVEAEALVTRAAWEQCLKAATVGMKLRKLLIDYDKLTADDIAEGLSAAFKSASLIPGLDLAGLEAATNSLVDMISKDADLKALFNGFADSLSAARGEA